MRRTGRRIGFTLIELLVVIAVTSMLLSLLIPAIASARGSALRVQCSSNLHNIGVAYAQRAMLRRHKSAVTANTWQADLAPHIQNEAVLGCPNTTTQPASTALVCRVTHGGWPLQSIPFGPGPRCQRRNETTNSYELWFEDWNNWDFRDLRVLVEQRPEGGEKVTVIQVDSSSTFDIQTEDGAPLLPNIDRHNWPGRSCTTTPTVPASYGMNNRSEAFATGDGRKILLLDYNKSVANVVGPDATDQFTAQVAPRHHSLCNVLYVDGSVSTFDPQEIDPANLQLHDTLWKPSRDQPLATPNP